MLQVVAAPFVTWFFSAVWELYRETQPQICFFSPSIDYVI